jgi:hypothetical protein
MSARATPSKPWVWAEGHRGLCNPRAGRFRHDLAMRSVVDWNDRSPPTAAASRTIKDGPLSTLLGHSAFAPGMALHDPKRSSRPQSHSYSVAVAPLGTRNVLQWEAGCPTGIQPLRSARIAGYLR